jgi:hypothetical protein
VTDPLVDEEARMCETWEFHAMEVVDPEMEGAVLEEGG